MATKKLNVAFIGTGIMGAPIAGHILDAGYPLTVFNRTKSKAEGLLAKGAVWADSPSAAAEGADVVFTMVGYPADVEEIYLSGTGLLACAKEGAYLIDLTTSAPELARDIAGAAEVCGKHAFDCPVTGGEGGAIAGTLTAIVGATERDIEPSASCSRPSPPRSSALAAPARARPPSSPTRWRSPAPWWAWPTRSPLPSKTTLTSSRCVR